MELTTMSELEEQVSDEPREQLRPGCILQAGEPETQLGSERSIRRHMALLRGDWGIQYWTGVRPQRGATGLSCHRRDDPSSAHHQVPRTPRMQAPRVLCQCLVSSSPRGSSRGTGPVWVGRVALCSRCSLAIGEFRDCWGAARDAAMHGNDTG